MKFTDMTTQINRYDVDKSSKLYRFIEIMIPLLVWATIFMPVWLSFFHPAVAAYLILGYMIYFFYKAMKTAYYSMVSFRLMKRVEQIDWLAEVKQIEGHRDIHHFILVVNYKESVAKLIATMEYLKKQNYDLKKINVVFGM